MSYRGQHPRIPSASWEGSGSYTGTYGSVDSTHSASGRPQNPSMMADGTRTRIISGLYADVIDDPPLLIQDSPNQMVKSNRWLPTVKLIPFTLAFVVALLIYIIPLMDNVFAQRCLSLLVGCSILWAFEALPLYVTSLLIPLLTVWMKVLPDPSNPDEALDASDAANVVSEQFWGPTIFLFLGGFTIAAALGKYGLNRALATYILNVVGDKSWVQVFTVMTLCVVLSAFISNPAASVLCVSVVYPIFKDLEPDSKFPRTMLLAIAFGGNIGGMTTPIASPQNAIALSTLENLDSSQAPISFLDWVLISTPFCFVALLGTFALIWLLLRPTEKTIPKTPVAHVDMGFPQWFILLTSALTVIMWMLNNLTVNLTGNIGITALIPVCAFFGSGYLTVSDFDSLAWNILMLMGGGLALGYDIQASSLLQIIADQIADVLGDSSVWVVMLAFVLLVIAVGTFISSTVAAIVILPIVAEVGNSLDPPHANMLVFAAVVMCSGAMALPVASFPNANSFAVKNEQTNLSYLRVTDYLLVGLPVGLMLVVMCQTILYAETSLFGY